MKKVKRRATAALLIAALLVVGLSVYLVRLADNGGAWASYFNGGTPGGTILDRNGVVLYTSDENGYSFAEDWATRVSCYHLIGDANGNVWTGALRQFRDRLSGYSFIEGTTSGETISLTVDSYLNTVAYSAMGREGRGLHAHRLHDERDTLHGLHAERRPGKPQLGTGGRHIPQ